MSTLDKLVNDWRAGKIAPHVYTSDRGSRDPECAIGGCRWSWDQHVDSTLLTVIKEQGRVSDEIAMSTQDKTKHTSLPWKYYTLDLGDEDYCLVPAGITGADGFAVVSTEGGLAPDSEWSKELIYANAELIVRSVNSHQQLVDALKAAKELIRAFRDEGVPINMRAELWEDFQKQSEIMQQINSALDAAKEKE